MPTARFDDLRPRRRRSFVLGPCLDILTAREPSEVVPLLDAVEEAVASGRWVAGWVSYEAAPAFDPALEVRGTAGTPLESLPLAWFSVHDGRGPATSGDRPKDYRLGPWRPSMDEAEHRRGVEAIRDHIRRGDTYQVNHTLRLAADFEGDAESLHADLIRAQNTAYGAFLDTGRWVVASASPELFFEWRHGRLVSKPMKGTAPRGVDQVSDEEQRTWLEGSEKNRAENLMIVDMVRNDMGRIALTGSVEVPALFTTEKYDTVWQLTSTVAARPRADVGLSGVFRALFPSASITGAPKVATMAIIASLEESPRGVYCGAIGFGGPGPDGRPGWAFNVGIRTVLVDRRAGVAHYGTGGGITYDSTPSDEYREALLKTEVLARRSADFSLLETMRWDPDAGFRHLDHHLDRLTGSAAYFDVPLDPAEVRAVLDRTVEDRPRAARVRLVVDRTGWATAEASDLPLSPAHPLRLVIDDAHPVDRADPFLHHKTTNRRLYDQATARHPWADDVILVNEVGQVTETTIANLVVEVDGQWVTPPTSAGCLAGTERRWLLEVGKLEERELTVDEVRRAARLARVNALRGWEPAVLAREPPVSPGAWRPACDPTR